MNVDPVAAVLFIALLLNLVRFYLGNVRLLDDCYLSPFGRLSSQGTERRQSLPFDYFVILVTGVLLALLSFYLRDTRSFFILFAVILLLDIIWYVITWKDSRDVKIRTQRRWWTVNNVGHIFFVAYGFIAPLPDQSWWWLVPAIAVFTNTAVDFILSWKFYFFTSSAIRRMNPRIFLAAPFTQTIDRGTGRVEVAFRSGLEDIIKDLEAANFEVFSAHFREEWGAKLEDPATALVRDLRELQESDVVVGFLGNPPSPGVQMEFGAAITMGKPIVYLIKNGDSAPYLTDGIPLATKAIRISFDTYEEASMKIRATLENLKANKWMDPAS